MVRAIWNEPRIEEPRKAGGETTYTTPYLELMFAAIRLQGITEEHQSKKELLVDWYRVQEIERKQISIHMAAAMATLIRHPKSQRGGAKRMIGSDLREMG